MLRQPASAGDNLANVGQANPIDNGAGLLRVHFSAAAGSEGSFEILLGLLRLFDAQGNEIAVETQAGSLSVVVDATPPQVADIRVRSTRWTNNTFPFAAGYSIPGGADQLRPLPWFDVNVVAMPFSEPVQVERDDAQFRGVSVATYAIADFRYDASSHTATWTLATPLGGGSLPQATPIERLLERDEFADYWAMKWCDLLRVKSEFPIKLWPNAVQAYHRWIRTSVQENRPYDRFVREMLTSSGSNFRDPQVNFYRAVQSRGRRSPAGQPARQS